MPKVTVAIAAYNCARLLPATLDSILAQTFKDLEIVVADDCSTDNTVEVLKSYGKRIRWLSMPRNGGAGPAWNAAVKASAGEYLVIAAADDIWKPERLAPQVRLLDEHPEYGMAYCRIGKIDEHGNPMRSIDADRKYPSGDVFEELFVRSCFIPASTAMIRRSAFDKAGGFDPEIRLCQDWDLYLRIAHDFQVGFVDEVLVLYRRYPSQMSKKREQAFQHQRMVMEKINKLYRNDEKRIAEKAYRKAHGRQLMKEGCHWLEEGQKAKARKLFKEALRLNPANLRAGRYLLKTLFAKR